MKSNYSFEIKILIDNRSKPEKSLFTEFGFSALICNEFTERHILFDTGATFETLKNNLEQMEERITDIDKVVISHNHMEHIGGLKGVCENNPDIDIYVPEENRKSYCYKYKNARIHGISDEMEIDENIISTGQLGNYLKEQSLFLKTIDDEGVIMLGCGHPGLEEIIRLAKQKFSKICGIIGGFHDFRKYTYLSDIDVIGPCHCTNHLNNISKNFPKNFKEIFAGEILRF